MISIAYKLLTVYLVHVRIKPFSDPFLHCDRHAFPVSLSIKAVFDSF